MTTEFVSSGIISSGNVVSNSDQLIVLSGGQAHDLTVLSGGELDVLGEITSSVVVSSGGIEIVSSGGVVSGASNSGTAIHGSVTVLESGSLSLRGHQKSRQFDRFIRRHDCPRDGLKRRRAGPAGFGHRPSQRA